MNDAKTTIQDLKEVMKKFVTERDWKQFHTPKSLSMAISAEAAELMEHFLWQENKESVKTIETKRQEIEHELADIIMFVLSFANQAKIDVSSAVTKKMKLNVKKYPITKAKGKATKYTEL